MISFKGTHFPKDVILYAVFFYVRYGVSYRDLEEIMEERAGSRYFCESLFWASQPKQAAKT
jgi:transposase-like protein